MQILLFAGVAPARETPFGMVDAVGDAKRQGLARPDERQQQAPNLSLAQHADEPVAISPTGSASISVKLALDI
jgi:hypothetical protein